MFLLSSDSRKLFSESEDNRRTPTPYLASYPVLFNIMHNCPGIIYQCPFIPRWLPLPTTVSPSSVTLLWSLHLHYPVPPSPRLCVRLPLPESNPRRAPVPLPGSCPQHPSSWPRGLDLAHLCLNLPRES